MISKPEAVAYLRDLKNRSDSSASDKQTIDEIIDLIYDLEISPEDIR